MAGQDGPVVSLDVPSGVDAGSGRVEGAAVRARMTVTYHGDMVGLRIAPGRGHAGRVVVADIGIPGAVALPPTAWLVGAGAVAAVPRKGEAGDKYAAGAVLVVAGSPGLTGAASLAARATLRAGAGLTVVAVPAEVQPAVAAHLLEVMCAPLPDREGHLAPESVERVESEARRASALAIGPGLGRAECTTDAMLQILDRVALPAVLDADGLWHLEDAPERLAARTSPTVITPHAGEAARLLGRTRGEVEAGRLDAARELARRSGAVALLKGPGTIVASPGGEVAVSAGGTPALATAGTGDVLTGTVAALLAKGMEPFRGRGGRGGRPRARRRAGRPRRRHDRLRRAGGSPRRPRAAALRSPVTRPRAVARIDLGAIRHNAARLARAAGGARRDGDREGRRIRARGRAGGPRRARGRRGRAGGRGGGGGARPSAPPASTRRCSSWVRSPAASGAAPSPRERMWRCGRPAVWRTPPPRPGPAPSGCT